jgi:hypothetical protein
MADFISYHRPPANKWRDWRCRLMQENLPIRARFFRRDSDYHRSVKACEADIPTNPFNRQEGFLNYENIKTGFLMSIQLVRQLLANVMN